MYYTTGMGFFVCMRAEYNYICGNIFYRIKGTSAEKYTKSGYKNQYQST